MYYFDKATKDADPLFDLCSDMIRKKDTYTKDVYADIAKYIIPERSTLFNQEQQGQEFGKDIYDGWAGYCHRKMVSAMYGSLCPQNTSWMEFQLLGEKPPSDILAKLHKLNLAFMRRLDKSNFYGNQTQFISDGAGFGNGVQYVKDDIIDEKVKFITIHPAQYYIYTESDGDVKAILRKMKMNYNEVIKIIQSSTMAGRDKWQDFLPDETVSYIESEGQLGSVTVFSLMFFTKHFRNFIEVPPEYNAPVTEVWYISKEGKAGDIFCINKHEYFPYIVWRFHLESGWHYGFGPGHYALHDSRVLQQLARANLEAWQRAAAPPIQAPEELKNKVKNRPYGITYYEDSSRMLQPLYTQQNATQATEGLKQKRELISFHYMLDIWQTLSDITARMTAYEVAERIGEKLSMVSAVIGNFLNEGLSQQVKLAFEIEVSSGRLPIDPDLQEYIQAQGLKIEYTSLLAQSLKKQLENQGLMRTIGEMQMAFELNQDLAMAFDWYAVAERMIAGSTTSLEVLKDKKQYKMELEQIKQMQQEMMAQKQMGGQNAKGVVQ